MNFFCCLPFGDFIKKAIKRLKKTRQTDKFIILQEKLVKAVLSKKWKKVSELISKGADINHNVTKFGEPLLFFAKDITTIKKLLELGADINARDFSGEGILGHAILNSWSLDAIQELIDQGASLTAYNNLLISPLERAVAVGNYDKIKLLIENGACYVNERASETPMNYCINNFEGAKTVIKHVMLKYFEQNYTELIGLENYNFPYIFKNYQYLKEYFTKCEIELQRLRLIKIDRNRTLLDLIRFGHDQVNLDSHTDELRLLLGGIENNPKKNKRNMIFPIYQDLIVKALKSAIQRKSR